ncbi:MAG: FtsK/SpoIIIE domain-containing protein [Dermabacter sp.]|nr:FtsK/SpoIIIE domain-containing protein [Dermabacter sp.]
MDVRLTWDRPCSTECRDREGHPCSHSSTIDVTADQTARVGDLAAALSSLSEAASTEVREGEPDKAREGAPQRARVPGTSVPSIRIGASSPHGQPGTVLPPSALLATSALLSGTVIEVGDAPVAGPNAREESGAAPGRRGRRARTHLPAGAPNPAEYRLLIEGPDGRRHVPLTGPQMWIGSDPACDVVLRGRDVEPRHARLSLPERRVQSASDAAPLWVDGHETFEASVEGSRVIGIGDLTLRLVHQGGDDTTLASTEAVAHLPNPRFIDAASPPAIPLPSPPKSPQAVAFPVVMMIVPVFMAAGLWFMTQSRFVLVFALFMPMLALANYASQKRNAAYQHREALARFDDELDAAATKAHAWHTRERAHLDERFPDPGRVRRAIPERSRLLWSTKAASPDFLHVRLGVGSRVSAAAVEAPAKPDVAADDALRLDDVAAEISRLDEAPVDLDLGAANVAVIGEVSHAAPVAVSILITAAGLHSPEDLTVAAFVGEPWVGPLGSLAWLPHASYPVSAVTAPRLVDEEAAADALLADLEQIVAARQQASRTAGADAGSSSMQRILVVVADPAPVERARLVQLAFASGPEVGVHLLWCARSLERVPQGCPVLVHVDGTADAPGSAAVVGHLPSVVGRDGLAPSLVGGAGVEGALVEGVPVAGALERVADGSSVQPLALATVGRTDALECARSLAPVVDARTRIADSADIPSLVTLADATGLAFDALDADLSARWALSDADPARTLEAAIGHDGRGSVRLALRTAGPHALVAGTTGAGKSEFLQSWVLALAAEYSPSALTFLFIDYKGGAAFAECVDLPHCVGLVTDLSGALVQRALVSLRAELVRREEILARAEVKDLPSLEARGEGGCPPALIIVVDEFAALMRDVPEFVDELVDIAARGRSLGLHLVLATQRPAGIVSERLRANTTVRVALRLADAADSHDVIGTADAARITAEQPGRGLVRTGPRPPRDVQMAYAGRLARARAVPPRLRVSPGPLSGETWGPVIIEHERAGLGAGDLSEGERLVQAARQLAVREGREAPRRPWLEPLPASLGLVELAELAEPRAVTPERGVPVALIDMPSQQRQFPWHYSPATSPRLLLIGAAGAGATEALDTVISSLALWPRVTPAHAYVIDSPQGSHASLAELPHVGSVIPATDTDRALRLLRTLVARMRERAEAFRTAGARSLSEHAQKTGKRWEYLVLAIESYAGLMAELGPREAEGATAMLTALARDGEHLGIALVVGTSRSREMPTVLDTAMDQRAIFRLARKEDEAMLGLSTPVGPDDPPGRALIDARSAQFARPPSAGDLERCGGGSPGDALASPPVPIIHFPRRLAEHELPAPAPDGHLILGLDAGLCEGVSASLRDLLVVAGGPGSGKSSLLERAEAQAARSGMTVWRVRGTDTGDPDESGERQGSGVGNRRTPMTCALPMTCARRLPPCARTRDPTSFSSSTTSARSKARHVPRHSRSWRAPSCSTGAACGHRSRAARSPAPTP